MRVATTRKLSVTISNDLYDFLEFLMVEKKRNKSATVEHLIRSGIAANEDYHQAEHEFILKQYDMFKNKDGNITDKAIKLKNR